MVTSPTAAEAPCFEVLVVVSIADILTFQHLVTSSKNLSALHMKVLRLGY